MRTLAILLWAVLSLTAFADLDVSVEKSRAISGVAKPRVVGDVVLYEGDQGPKVVPVAIVSVVSDYKFVRVKARTSLFEATNLEKISDGVYLLKGPGKFALEATAFDPEKGIDEKVVIVELGDAPAPEPDPEPDPKPEPDKPVPPDNFDNIGQRVAKAIGSAPKQAEVAKLYRDGAFALREDPLITVNGVFERVYQARTALVGGDASWKPFIELIALDVKQRWPMSRGVVADYFDAVAVGLGDKR